MWYVYEVLYRDAVICRGNVLWWWWAAWARNAGV